MVVHTAVHLQAEATQVVDRVRGVQVILSRHPPESVYQEHTSIMPWQLEMPMPWRLSLIPSMCAYAIHHLVVNSTITTGVRAFRKTKATGAILKHLHSAEQKVLACHLQELIKLEPQAPMVSRIHQQLLHLPLGIRPLAWLKTVT